MHTPLKASPLTVRELKVNSIYLLIMPHYSWKFKRPVNGVGWGRLGWGGVGERGAGPVSQGKTGLTLGGCFFIETIFQATFTFRFQTARE